MKKLLYIVVLAALTLATSSAATVACPSGSLAQYLAAGFECQTGALTFDTFGLTSGISASDILVAPTVSGNTEALVFSSAFWAVNNFTGGPQVAVDSLITFRVRGDMSDMWLQFNGAVAGSGFASVSETYCIDGPVETCGSAGQLYVYNPPADFNDHIALAGARSIYVSKDINLTTLGLGSATISQVTNAFTVTGTPEPSSMILMGAGLLVMGGLLRSRFGSR